MSPRPTPQPCCPAEPGRSPCPVLWPPASPWPSPPAAAASMEERGRHRGEEGCCAAAPARAEREGRRAAAAHREREERHAAAVRQEREGHRRLSMGTRRWARIDGEQWVDLLVPLRCHREESRPEVAPAGRSKSSTSIWPWRWVQCQYGSADSSRHGAGAGDVAKDGAGDGDADEFPSLPLAAAPPVLSPAPSSISSRRRDQQQERETHESLIFFIPWS